MTGLVVWGVASYLGGVGPVVGELRHARWRLVPGVVLLSVAIFVLSVYRWRVILAAMGHPVTPRRTLTAILGTWPLAAVSPSRASDLLRAWLLRDEVPLLRGVGSVATEKLIDIHSLCLLSLAGSLLAGQPLWGALAAALLAALWLALGLVARARHWRWAEPWRERFDERLNHALAALAGLGRHPHSLMLAAGTSVLAWLLAAAMAWLLLRTFGVAVPAVQVLALWPIAIFAGQIPITIGGLGTRDAAFVLLVQGAAGAGAAREPALLAATLSYSLISFWLWVIVGIPVMAHLGLRSPLAKAASPGPDDESLEDV